MHQLSKSGNFENMTYMSYDLQMIFFLLATTLSWNVHAYVVPQPVTHNDMYK